MKKKWITVLELSKLVEIERVQKAREIADKMDGNAFFPEPRPPLADMLAQADTTEEAYVASRDASTGDTATFHTQLDLLERMLNKQANYVEDTANDDPDNGDEIIKSAGMKPKEQGAVNIADFAVEKGKALNSASARQKGRRPRASYFWYIREKGTQEWALAGKTLQAKFTYTGLAPLTAYELRGSYMLPDNVEIFLDPVDFQF